MSKLLELTVMLAVVMCVSAAFAQDDVIVIETEQGRILKVESITIARETYREIRYRIHPEGWSSEPTEGIVEVIHGNPPHRFARAEEARNSGEWEEALKLYRECVEREQLDWVKTYSAFYVGECLRMLGERDKSRYTDALAAYKQFIKEHEDHRFVPHATLGIALASGELNEVKMEKGACDELGSDRYGTKWGIRGRFGSARIALRNGEPASLKNMRAVAAEAKRAGMIDIWSNALLLTAQTLATSKDYAAAEQDYRGILADGGSAPAEILAVAHNGLAECLSVSGKSKEALFEYLKVLVLYAGVRTEYLKALRKAIDLLEEIGGDDYLKRARELGDEYAKAMASEDEEEK
jgi:tetratricopeptide (TPR) repeat protein